MIEGLLSAFADSVSVLEPLDDVFLRANGYSLARGARRLGGLDSANGPGAFGGPFVGGGQAVAVLAASAAVFAALAAWCCGEGMSSDSEEYRHGWT